MKKTITFFFLVGLLHGMHFQQQVVITGHHRKIFNASVPVNSPKVSPVIFDSENPVVFAFGEPVVIQ